ncbi:MAG: DUF4363 family protein [Firmicutes bacterium]|nr:DUF4363 family protein [Bacillota bacterium]
MIVRSLIVLGLVLLLAGLVVGEQLYVNHVFGKMKDETAIIMEYVHETPEDKDGKVVFSEELKTRINALREYWLGHEHRLCIFIKHIDVSYISDAITYAKNFIDFDNKEEASNGLSRLEYLLNTYHSVYGLNGLNIL